MPIHVLYGIPEKCSKRATCVKHASHVGTVLPPSVTSWHVYWPGIDDMKLANTQHLQGLLKDTKKNENKERKPLCYAMCCPLVRAPQAILHCFLHTAVDNDMHNIFEHNYVTICSSTQDYCKSDSMKALQNLQWMLLT
jgi:hypothetical protein